MHRRNAKKKVPKIEKNRHHIAPRGQGVKAVSASLVSVARPKLLSSQREKERSRCRDDSVDSRPRNSEIFGVRA